MRRDNKLKLTFLILLIFLFLLSFFFKDTTVFDTYENYLFLPYQQLRSYILNNIPFSVGDILYLLVACILLISIFRFFRFSILYKSRKGKLNKLLATSVVSLLSVYVLYFYSWGANYTRAKIWKPTEDTVWTRPHLEALNDTLIHSLNILDHTEEDHSLAKMNAKVRSVYKDRISERVPGLMVKPSLFGNAIYYFGIQGYYNPITGEAQFARSLPPFMWGFVIAHEMAHQTGIAAEGEANFMAYVMCVKSEDVQLQYSAYFNLFLYANRELARYDSAAAADKRDLLRPGVIEHLKTLEAHRMQYKSIFRGTVLSIYNWMLRSQGQAKGLKSYGDITRLVYLWEKAGEPDVRPYR